MVPAPSPCCREEALRAAGFTDIFRQIKAKENSSALGLLRDVCAELDQHSEQARILRRSQGGPSLFCHLVNLPAWSAQRRVDSLRALAAGPTLPRSRPVLLGSPGCSGTAGAP